MHSHLRLLSLLAAMLLASCGGGGHANTASPAPSAAAATETPSGPTASSQTSTVPTELPSGATPTPRPTETPVANLLSPQNGTILRSYPAVFDDPNSVRDVAESPPDLPDKATGPFVYVFELPGPTKFTSFTTYLHGHEQPFDTVAIAVSASGPDSGFSDVGTMTGSDSSGEKSLSTNATGRWVRVTSSKGFSYVTAAGTVAPLPAGVVPNGLYMWESAPFAKGVFVPGGVVPDHWNGRLVSVGNGLNAVGCKEDGYRDADVGMLDGRTWTSVYGTDHYRGAVNDDGSIVTRTDDGGHDPQYLVKVTAPPPAACSPYVYGSGQHHVLALASKENYGLWSTDKDSVPAGYTVTTIDAGMLDEQLLAGQEAAISKDICNINEYLNPPQQQLLLQWVAAGHKLIFTSADECGNGSDYSWLPYPFKSSNPGAKGAHGDRLIQVENDALGTSDKSDGAHFFDPQIYAKDEGNQLGDADTVVTQDSHWCGHLFGTNANNVNGFMQMYAIYGKGVIVYDAFDHDDADRPGYQRVRTLELALPVPSDLPCTQSVALAFLIQPNQEATFVSGTAATLHAPMETLANQGWKGHVTITTTGDFPATVTPDGFDMNGGTQPLAVTVNVPASAKPGAYTVTVVGTGNDGKTAQASVTITGTAPLKKAVLKKHQRIRIYGIHFDVDSAHIQPRSEPVIAQIATLMKQNPSWKFEISGHTDSDGGAAYNLGLSQRRAQAVVNDLVTRYGIARSRMVAKGYGLTRPVATNSTTAGKALNRRVELERLQ